MTQSFDALILGGGAAGLMCAIEAGKRGRRVAVLERADKLVQLIALEKGLRHPAIDAQVALVDERLAANRKAAKT